MRTATSLKNITLLSTFAASACMDDGTELDPELGDTEQDVSWFSSTQLYSCSTTGNSYNTCSFDLNVAADGHHACILNGIEGAITANGIVGGGSAVITSYGNRFQLAINTGYGNGGTYTRTISASAACFAADPVPARTSGWTAGNPPTTLANAADSANMMCFMRGIDIHFNGFNDPTSNVWVKKNELGSWQVGGNQTNGTNLGVYTQCVRPVGGAAWFYTYGWNGPTTFLPLAPNDPPGGVVCGLNKIQGRFLYSSDKVSVSYASFGTKWVMGFGGAAHEGDSYCFN